LQDLPRHITHMLLKTRNSGEGGPVKLKEHISRSIFCFVLTNIQPSEIRSSCRHLERIACAFVTGTRGSVVYSVSGALFRRRGPLHSEIQMLWYRNVSPWTVNPWARTIHNQRESCTCPWPNFLSKIFPLPSCIRWFPGMHQFLSHINRANLPDAPTICLFSRDCWIYTRIRHGW
jgi:hypothetical protein